MTTSVATAVDASVMVCTRNRCDALARLLARLEHLVVPAGVRWELIVVDNGSTDGTAALLRAYCGALPLRVVREPRPGLSRARNAGLSVATGDLLLFTDDDCLPDPHWLASVRQEFARAPELDVLGGRVELYDERDQPTTTRTSRERRAITMAFNLDGIIGCNMAFRRSVLSLAGPFDVALGGGTAAGAGEDVDFVYRALRAGFRAEYVPDALVYHNHGRRTAAQVRALKRVYTVARGALFCKYLLARDRAVLARIKQDLMFHMQMTMDDVRGRRFPRRLVRHYYHLGVGAAYWLRHRLTERDEAP